ncbi:MAG: WhiB family transcriptional regulator [Actinomycetia bacterium]|nr:WhiB family transcriptional regulator [Actinomycetes bacterium]
MKRLEILHDWRELAKCGNHPDPDLFFDQERRREALAICAGCPVKAPCRELGEGSGGGVWGAKAARYSAHGITTLPVCHGRTGTEAGYKRHLRAGEAPCSACRQGQSQTKRHQRGRR